MGATPDATGPYPFHGGRPSSPSNQAYRWIAKIAIEDSISFFVWLGKLPAAGIASAKGSNGRNIS